MPIVKGSPFFGEFGDFQGEFSNVEKLELIIEREERFHDRLGCEWSKHTYNETDVPDKIPCSSHPRCLRLGYDIRAFLTGCVTVGNRENLK